MRMGFIRCFVGCALASFVCLPRIQAQTVTGSITGEVTDPTGAVVPKAQVTAENLDTGVRTQAQTNDSGVYTLRFLPIGHYTVVVDAKGFSSQTVPSFALEINQTVSLNERLAVGTTSSVEVDSSAAILNTSDATLGITISSNEISNIPLEGRNFSSVTLFQPGAVSTAPTGMTGVNAIERDTSSSGVGSINGNRQQGNNYTLDGIDINEGQNNLIGYNPAPDAIEEIKVISANAPATYGNVSGGAVVSVLKSGTNKFHGSAYGYLQNEKLDANSWTNKDLSTIIPRNPFTQSIFGGTFGGPVRRDKLFFFGDYEGVREHMGGSGPASVIPLAMRNGDFSAVGFQLYNTQGGFAPYSGNQLPILNPVAKFLFAHPEFYPAPNTAPQAGSLLDNNFQGPTKKFIVNNQFDVKTEWDPRNSDKVTAFYAQSRAYDGSTAVLAISFPSFSIYPSKLGGGTWVHTFSPSIVNEARIGFTRIRWNQGVPTDPTGFFGLNGDSLVGIPFGVQQYPGFAYQNISDLTNNAGGFGTPAAPQIYVDNTFTYGDNLTIQKGKHLLSIGAQALRYQQQFLNSANFGSLGTFAYTGIFTSNPSQSTAGYGPADFVLDNVAQTQIEDGGESGQRQWRVAGFFQDDWKVLPNLTVNLGIRYEFDQPWYEVNNRTANVLLDSGVVEYAGSVPAGAPAGSIVCPNRACYQPNYKQFMPRLGFALQVSPRFVVRGGYGATSFFEGNSTNQRLTYNSPFVAFSQKNSVAPTATNGGQGYTVEQGFGSAAGDINTTGAGFGAWPQNIQPAYIQEFNLTTEFEINSRTSFTVGYVGETGQHIEDYRNGNQLTVPGDFTTAPFAALVGTGGPLTVTESRAMMNYNALQATLRQRANHGLEYTINYTYGRAMTNSAGNYQVPSVNGSNGAFQDGYNSRADYGPAGQDVRHNLSAIGVYALPFGHNQQFGSHVNRLVDEAIGGWSISSTLIAFTGLPDTLSGPNNSNSNSDGAARPNQYRKLKVVNRSITNWWGTDPSATPCNGPMDNGTCAYGQAATNTFGNAAIGTERDPGYYQVDSSLFKDFHITEGQKIGFRLDAFNVLNVADYGAPDSGITDGAGQFGLINTVRNQERRLQLALNYKF
jgi:Carboxypeptidase regulatory-like domain/TonB-dependent Receptor Plug Domain